MDRAEAETLFYYAAVSQALALGFRLGAGADADLLGEAKRAAALIFDPQRPDDNRENEIEQAVHGFRTIVDRMISQRYVAYAHDPQMLQSRIIGEDTLARVRQIFCPGFFPFC